MNFMNSMLGLVGSWKALIENTNIKWTGEWLTKLLDILSQVLWVAMALVAAAGAVYAVYVGIKMARAESAEQRDENKKRFINILVSIIVVIVLIVVFNVIVPMVISAFAGDAIEDPRTPSGESVTHSVSSIATILNTARVFLHM